MRLAGSVTVADSATLRDVASLRTVLREHGRIIDDSIGDDGVRIIFEFDTDDLARIEPEQWALDALSQLADVSLERYLSLVAYWTDLRFRVEANDPFKLAGPHPIATLAAGQAIA